MFRFLKKKKELRIKNEQEKEARIDKMLINDLNAKRDKMCKLDCAILGAKCNTKNCIHYYEGEIKLFCSLHFSARYVDVPKCKLWK